MSLNPHIGSSTSKAKSSITPGRSSGQNVYDRMAALFQEVRTKHMEGNNSNKDDILGYCLYCHLLTVTEFKNQHKNNDPFIKEVLKSSDNSESTESSYIMEVYVNIPEITGLLPEPKLEYIFGLLKSYNEIATTDQTAKEGVLEITRNLIARSDALAQASEAAGTGYKAAPSVSTRSKEVNEALEELAVMAMYPRFYKYTSTGEVMPPGAICKVKYSDSLTSKFAGICIEQIDSNFKHVGQNPLREFVELLKNI